jgi:glycosyltransferase involved in cell wall biosynthesis
VFARVRRWDRRTAARVTHFVAISRTVEQRIRDAYDRPSEVIYPPVDTRFFCPGPERREGFYLCVSALVPYKRIDLAIRACALKDRELVIIGRGPEREALRRMAGPRVRLLGWQSDEIVRHYLRRCRALLFPGREDFGIVPVEAQACGTPVIAYGEGGATEGLVPITSDGSGTAVFFDRQQPESLAAAIAWLEGHRIQFSAALAREQATRFSTARFEAQMAAYLHAVVSGKLPQGGQTDHGGDGIEVHTPHSSLPDPPHRRRVGATHDPGELAQPWQLV